MVWRWPWATEEWRWRLRFIARKIGKSRESRCISNWMSFTRPILLGPVFFRTALPCSGGYHLERGGMPLHDAVGINCKTKPSRFQLYGLRIVDDVDDCVCVIWIDMTTPPWWMEKVMVYYYYIHMPIKVSIRTVPQIKKNRTLKNCPFVSKKKLQNRS